MKKMVITIMKSRQQSISPRYCATIEIDGEFFKEVGGTLDPLDLLECISDSLRNDDDFKL